MRKASSRNGLALALCAAMALISLAGGGSARAGSITFVTGSPTESGGNPVDATAQITTGSNTITIVLTNLEVNPTTVAQNVSDFSFTINGGTLTGATVAESGNSTTVAKDGSYSTPAADTFTWVPTLSGSSGSLTDLSGSGHSGPAYTILGAPDPSSGLYDSTGNGSIAGNNAHNPFLFETATFTITGATGSGITSSTTITGFTFSFGTTAGNDVTGVAVPEPGSLVLGLIGAGVAGGIGLRRRNRNR